MDAKLKEDWLTALEGGEYPQTTGALRDGGGFCCLGVLCDVLRHRGQGEWRKNQSGRSVFYTPELINVESGGHNWELLAPEAVLDTETQRTLADKNDNSKWTFQQIAKWIKENV